MKKINLLLAFFLLTTIGISQNDIVYDIDSNMYHSIEIGGNYWLQENLRVGRYNNGDSILTSETYNMSFDIEASPKYQWINPYGKGLEYNHKVYGRLYTFYVISDNRKVCPQGWHVSTDAEWSALEDAVGGRSKAGGRLKEAGLEHWKAPNSGIKKTTNFKALPSGERTNTRGFNYFKIIGYWWTATEKSENIAITRRMMSSDGKAVNRSAHKKDMGFAIRCVKD